MVVPIVGGVQGNADKAHAVTLGGADKASACFVGKACFYADTIGVHFQQLIGIGEGAVIWRIAKIEGDRLLTADSGKIGVLQGFGGKERHIICGGIVVVMVKPGGGYEMGVCKSHLGCTGVHKVGKFFHRPRNFYGGAVGGVVARGQEHSYAQVSLGDDVPLDKSHGRAFGKDGGRVNGEFGIEVAAFKGDEGGHYFGGACHGAACVFLLAPEDTSAVGFDENCAEGGDVGGDGYGGDSFI